MDRNHGASPDAGFPVPDAEALAHSQRLVGLVEQEIAAGGGRLPFDRYMELALYAPGLGYYVAGERKFGREGDFITAPETSPLFARCLARQCGDVLSALGGGEILEVGAGSGVLAAGILDELEVLGSLPDRLRILELSPELRLRQQSTLQTRVPHLLPRVSWVERLTDVSLRGLVLANEVLDAMPVHRFRIAVSGSVEEQFVRVGSEGLELDFDAPTSTRLVLAVNGIRRSVGTLPEGYVSEVNLRAAPWLDVLSGVLENGVLLLVDYGYERSGFYHPERGMGTLMCHYRHRAHPDPLWHPGLQDITAHVDFSAIAEHALAAGFDLAGFSTQAHFLLGCGLDQLVANSSPDAVEDHFGLMQEVKRLTLPSEMGERFKVLGLAKGEVAPLAGFSVRDLRDRL
jgi:SAM-dependent MidA family methyltransferase